MFSPMLFCIPDVGVPHEGENQGQTMTAFAHNRSAERV
jgi:hypothetical protein